MRLHGCAKFFRDSARFGFLNAKMHNLPLFYLFWVIFEKNVCFWPILFAQNFQTEILVTQKKIACRKSDLNLLLFVLILLFNRPSVAGTVLQSPPSLIH